MAAGRITDLIPFKSPVPLDVRVIRKYSMQWSTNEQKKFYFLLTDSDGNVVEARIETKAKRVESQMSLYGCYHLTGFVVDPPASYGRVVDQAVTIVIADRTQCQPIPNGPMPKQYFSFGTYDMLAGRFGDNGKNIVLTDYLCRIESASAIMKRRASNLLKMTVIDITQKPIEITLWEKTAYTYVNLLSAGKVIAVSSLKVTKYKRTGVLQLESTNATTIDLELAIEGHEDEIKSLKLLAAQPSYNYGYHTEQDIRNNVTTLSSILSNDPVMINNQKFSCIAALKEIHAYRSWFSRKCSTCKDPLRIEDLKYICKQCGDITHQNITYCVNATLFDGTAELPVVLFDQAMTQILGVECEKLVLNEGYDDPKILPPPIESLIGKEKIYHFTFHANETTSIEQTLEVFSPNSAMDISTSTTAVPGTLSQAPTTPAAKAPKRQSVEQADVTPMKKSKEKEA